MTKIPRITPDNPNGLQKQFRKMPCHFPTLVAALLAALFFTLLQSQGQTLPSSYHVSLAWDAHPDPTVTAYRVHFGTVTGIYTSSIMAGNATSIKIPGLAKDIIYFFAVTAINRNGLESAYSNQVSFIPGLDEVSLQQAEDGSIDLHLTGLIDQTYEIEATQDLKNWTLISTVKIGDGGSFRFNDSKAKLYRSRFYRIHKIP